MEALLADAAASAHLTTFALSTLAVAIAEIGDKTQLLSLILVGRFGRPGLITLGILIATVANHGLAGWLGVVAAQLFDPQIVRWVLVGSFAVMAVWLLIPDRIDEDEVGHGVAGASVLLTTLILFFLAEIGDKTQVATIVLAARFEDDLLAVVAGTTLGMLLANVPVLYGGQALMRRLPLQWVNRAAALLFAVLAVATVLTG